VPISSNSMGRTVFSCTAMHWWLLENLFSERYRGNSCFMLWLNHYREETPRWRD